MNEPLTQPESDALLEVNALGAAAMRVMTKKLARQAATIQSLIDAWDTFQDTDDILVMDAAVSKARANND